MTKTTETKKRVYKSSLSNTLRLELDLALGKQNLIPKEEDVKIAKSKLRKGKKPTVEMTSMSPGFQATVIFAQYECGTGVCIDSTGRILTCAHCVGEKPKIGIQKIVLYSNGLMVLTKCIELDLVADLALLQVTGHYDSESKDFVHNTPSSYPSVKVGETITLGEPLVCFGQPGCDDLESKTERKTDYAVLMRSQGTFEGCLEGGDLNDNSEIGQLQHDCWTYWGHSGAGLFNQNCELVGIHSSWDDEKGTRHGIHLNAIRKFLRLT
jgi:hypothetical protein